MACISAETGTLTFAIINLVLVTLSSLSSLGLLVFWGVVNLTSQKSSEDDPRAYAYTVQVGVAQLAVIIVMLTASLVSLMFASFLMNGILKKNPAHLKVYYIFGVVKILFFYLCAVLTLTFTQYDGFDPLPLTIMTIIWFIYSLILYMIRYTYVQYESTNVQFAHQPLVEKC